jgi:DNA invertase Pin-like site-specific DNA recombinase
MVSLALLAAGNPDGYRDSEDRILPRAPGFCWGEGLWLRASGTCKAQIHGDGFPWQRTTTERFAKANHLTLVGEFRDGGVKGAINREHREGLAALLDTIESDGVKVVLVERADRLARDLMVSEVILGQFRDLGVRVISADSGVDLAVSDEDPTRTFIRQVLGAVAQFEKSVIVLKLRAARGRTRKSNGRCEGRKPFGIRPGEAAILHRMRQLRRKQPGKPRLSFTKIVQILNSEGYHTRMGKRWRGPTVRKILSR